MISRRRGFTLIELMITMAIMVILVAVAIVSLRSTQANGRDSERSSDVDTIARGLEQRYNNGMAEPSDGTQVIKAGTNSVGGPNCQLLGYGSGIHSKPFAFVGSEQELFAITQPTTYATEISNVPSLMSGTYPTTEELAYVQGTDDTAFCPEQINPYITEDLPGITSANLKTPSGGTFTLATSAAIPSVATVGSNYYYQPLDANGNLCATVDTECVKFKLYYVSEVDGTVHTIASKHQ